MERIELTKDGRQRILDSLVGSYRQLVGTEREARAANNERQLRGVLDGQQRVMARLRALGFFAD